MALNTLLLKNSIVTAFSQYATQIAPPGTEIDLTKLNKIAEDIANAMEVYVKSGTVSFSIGTVNGACPPGGGALTAGQATGGQMI